jgi:hypothetical protein
LLCRVSRAVDLPGKIPLTSSLVYRLHPAVAIELFGERALALHCVDLRLVELNVTAHNLLARLDGQTTLPDVAAALAVEYGQSRDAVLVDVQAVVSQMMDLGFVERVSPTGSLANGEETP